MTKGLVDLFSLNEMKSASKNNIKKASNQDIAVIGMSAKLPVVDDLEDFWNSLAAGNDFIREIPEQRRKDAESYLNFIGKESDAERFEEAAYLQEIDKFDYAFFGLSPNEAALMDPNQRLFLETAYQAIDDAGYGGEQIRGTRTAVFVAFSNESEYRRIINDTAPDLYPIAVTGNLPPIIASRVSYLLDLKGPSMIINTACSSSLVALHLGCQALKNGECSMAIIGGVQVHMLPVRQVQIGIESPDRRARSFDDSSNGTGGGEGVIAVMLKPLDKALQDDDHIYAVIKGSAYNQDGATMGISAPNPAAQEDVIVQAWQNAGIDASTISYIEAHGTGTKLGDPIEIEGIQRAFERYTDKKQFCAIGSVKSNIGHLDASAGLVGFLKAVLALKHRQIPPTLHFERPNRAIPFFNSPVYINSKLRKWKQNGGIPRRCGVSSFGFSGTNCHVVLEEVIQREPFSSVSSSCSHVLVLSAKSETVLHSLIEHYAVWNTEGLAVDDICYTAAIGRGHYKCRLALMFQNHEDLKQKLNELLTQGTGNYSGQGIFFKRCAPSDADKIKRADAPKSRKKENQQSTEILLSLLRSEGDIVEALLIRICELYIKGADIEWSDLYRFKSRRRVSLPGYPFERTRCWVNIPSKQEQQMNECFFTQDWIAKELKSPADPVKKGTFLVIGNSQQGRAISTELRNRGHGVIETDTVEDEFISFTPFQNTGIKDFTNVIFALDHGYSPSSSIEARLEKELYTCFRVIKQISASSLEALDIVIVTRYANKVDGSETAVFPESAAVSGLGKVINVEDYRLKCRSIDIDDFTDPKNTASEIEAGYQDYQVAYRGGQRYIQQLNNLRLEDSLNREIEIREKGVYLIAGGMGGIGLEIAKYFASIACTKLILMNRTVYPDREQWEEIIRCNQQPELAGKLKTVLEIEKSGSTVNICSVDITQREQLHIAISDIRSMYGSISGVVHCAAIGVGSQGELLKNDDFDTFRLVLSPKIHGTFWLDEETRMDDPDFFAAFSSPITVTGAIGSGGYTAANAFLDSFAAYRSFWAKNTVIMSWAPWIQTLASSNSEYASGTHLFNPLSTDEITGAFNYLLRKKADYAIVGQINRTGDIFGLEGVLPFRLSENVRRMVAGDKAVKPAESQSSIKNGIILKGEVINRYSESEKTVAAVWGQVFGYNELSVNDNFYELGGNSIIAMKVINNINQVMGLNLNVSHLLSNLTIRLLAALIDAGISDAHNHTPIVIKKYEDRDYYPVSMAQERMFLLSEKKEHDISWNMSWIYQINGRLDFAKLETAFHKLIERHDILRTSFELMDGKLVQRVHQMLEFHIQTLPQDSGSIEEIAKRFFRPFNFTQAPLMRVGVIEVNENESCLLLDIHHIIADAASMHMLIREVVSFYKDINIPRLPIQYKDYAIWQEECKASGELVNQREYWISKFADINALKVLPPDFSGVENGSVSGSRLGFGLTEDLVGKLRQLALATDTSLFLVLLSAFYVLIWKFSSGEDITIGVPIANRNHALLEGLIGMFVNTIALRTTPAGEKSFKEFLAEAKAEFLESSQHSDYPLLELVHELGIETTHDRNPLFDISFVMQNTGNEEINLGNDLHFIPYELEHSLARNTLLLEVIDNGDKLACWFEYRTGLFRQETIEQLKMHFMRILNEIVRDSAVRLKDIETVSFGEQMLIIEDFNEVL